MIFIPKHVYIFVYVFILGIVTEVPRKVHENSTTSDSERNPTIQALDEDTAAPAVEATTLDATAETTATPPDESTHSDGYLGSATLEADRSFLFDGPASTSVIYEVEEIGHIWDLGNTTSPVPDVFPPQTNFSQVEVEDYDPLNVAVPGTHVVYLREEPEPPVKLEPELGYQGLLKLIAADEDINYEHEGTNNTVTDFELAEPPAAAVKSAVSTLAERDEEIFRLSNYSAICARLVR